MELFERWSIDHVATGECNRDANGVRGEFARDSVVDAAGNVIVPTTTVTGDNPQASQNLEAPSAAGAYQLRLWLTDAEGNVGAPVTAPLTYECMRSHPAGGYRFPVPAGPLRELSAVYRPDQRQLRAAADLRTVVHPTLRTPRPVIKNKKVAHFEGEIPAPHNDQVTIVLQVKSGKGWLAFRRYRTRNDGHYDLEYRFRRTTRPTSYEMRAQVRETTGYPYEQGDSDPLTLRVVPGRARPEAKKPAKAKHRCAKGVRAVKRRGKAKCVRKQSSHRHSGRR